jgi:hypothetical protein
MHIYTKRQGGPLLYIADPSLTLPRESVFQLYNTCPNVDWVIKFVEMKRPSGFHLVVQQSYFELYCNFENKLTLIIFCS